jgi:AmmeMemoRadiSam system protein B/AmmeMemoRadiSam system protein A
MQHGIRRFDKVEASHFETRNTMTRWVLVLCCLLFDSSASFSLTVRPPAVAGQLYPADSAELSRMVKQHLKDAGTPPYIDGTIIALVVSHAGLVYSGPIAACGYRLLEGRDVNTVVLCGPSHRYRFSGISAYGPGVVWQTPLGQVLCDDSLSHSLMAADRDITVIPEAHKREHSLEVQLPYIQTLLPKAKIVPLTMGSQDDPTVRHLAKALGSLKYDGQTVLVAATDWQHYRPASEGRKLDSVGIKCLEQLDPDKLMRLLASGETEACGGGPTAAVLKAAIAAGANQVKILKYGDSGDLTGDKSSVVGYVAAVIYRSHDTPTKKPNQEEAEVKGTMKPSAQYISETDRKRLLEIARKSIEGYLADGNAPEFTVSDFLKEPGAAFVTLKEFGELRGCIGYTEAVRPLYQTVSQCAIHAATEDPRFNPVQASELPNIDIEISVLTPLQEVESLDSIKVGRDGLLIRMGRRSGLLLPQVATELGWNRTQFLEHTCQKAGLPNDSYTRPEATLYRFQAEVFAEE